MAQYHWWQSGVIYQIYPRSFMDSNSDGVGDLRGITQRLDYLEWLGIDAIWISPIYPSPMADFGYDVSNYTDVEPLFGTLADFDDLIAAAHARNIKVLLDYVPCHSSDEHPWFQESRSSLTNPKRDWYIWHDPAPDGGVPNNWMSLFEGSAWQYDEHTRQYYLHTFDVKQPDLNWRNPEVQQVMLDALRFWFDRGVDGFRLDAVSKLFKDEQFRDNPMRPGWIPGDRNDEAQIFLYTDNLPEVHDMLQRMRQIAHSYSGDRVLIGEIYLEMKTLMSYYGLQLDEVHMPFNFQFVTMPVWGAQEIRACVDPYEEMLPQGAWPNWVLGNHDRPRIVSRIGVEQARIAQILLLTLRGTPTCYYGDELGMPNVAVPVSMMHDPAGREFPEYSRDPERTPMQWNTGPNAGFSDLAITPWLPISSDYQHLNVEVERQDPHSFLSLTRSLLSLRRSHLSLSLGSYLLIDDLPEGCFAFGREYEGQRLLIVLNCSAQPINVSLPYFEQGNILLSTHLDHTGPVDLHQLHLPANEGYVIELTTTR